MANKESKSIAKTVAYSAMFVALALIFSYVEVLIPFNFGIPGVKLGLANLVVVTGLGYLDKRQVFIILAARIFLVSFMFGNMSMLIYSLAGGVLSFAVMCILSHIKGFSVIGVSVAGGISHNIGQLVVAMCVVENISLVFYLPVLMVSGMITGMLIGIISVRVGGVVGRFYGNTEL